MAKRTTYGVVGLLDWTAVIPIGKARMQVHFTGGAITKYGVIPAEYTTTDPVTQRIIEESAYYRSGKIVTLRSVGHNDIAPASRRCNVEARQAYAQATLPLDEGMQEPSLQTIEAACIEDAIEYMREHYSVPSVRIRNKESLQAVARQHGIQFEIKV